jgi:lycopene beta-cyclase
MSYAFILFSFVILPSLCLGWLVFRRISRYQLATISGLAGVALLYTTPWDNYLVATGVWWYDPDLVWGITLGWVPLEEYIFFVAQTFLTGLWLVWLGQRWYQGSTMAELLNLPPNESRRWRWMTSAGVVAIWLVSVVILVSGWKPGTYLGLELVWALPAILVQTAYGADILWANRRTVGIGIVTTTLYLSAVDALAIGSGTWTIDPEQSTDWLLGGLLPVEEFIFFALTNILIVFGYTLVTEGRFRFEGWRQSLQSVNQRRNSESREGTGEWGLGVEESGS